MFGGLLSTGTDSTGGFRLSLAIAVTAVVVGVLITATVLRNRAHR